VSRETFDTMANSTRYQNVFRELFYFERQTPERPTDQSACKSVQHDLAVQAIDQKQDICLRVKGACVIEKLLADRLRMTISQARNISWHDRRSDCGEIAEALYPSRAMICP
jgi:hypothetical protein